MNTKARDWRLTSARVLGRSVLGFCAVLFLEVSSAGAQRVAVESVITTDSLIAHEILKRDSTRVAGRIIAVSSDSIRLQRSSGVIAIARSDVKEIRQFSASRIRNDEYWPAHPNATTLLFSSTAYPLARGDRYYWTTWFILHGIVVGVTDHLTIGGGGTLIPGAAFDDQFYFFTPKLTLTGERGPQAAIGAFAGVVPGFGEEDHQSLGFLYGVGSVGSREKNFTAGLGWGYGGRRIAREPIIMFGGILRGARQVALISENWFLPDDDGYEGLMSLGFRFISHKVSLDVAYVGRMRERGFLGVPWVGLAVKF